MKSNEEVDNKKALQSPEEIQNGKDEKRQE